MTVGDPPTRPVARVGGKIISLHDVVAYLKLTGEWEGIIERMVRREVALGLAATEVQLPGDDSVEILIEVYLQRRGAGDAAAWLGRNGLSADELRRFVIDESRLAQLRRLISSEQVADYFERNSHRFASGELTHALCREIQGMLLESRIDTAAARAQVEVLEG